MNIFLFPKLAPLFKLLTIISIQKLFSFHRFRNEGLSSSKSPKGASPGLVILNGEQSPSACLLHWPGLLCRHEAAETEVKDISRL